MRILKRRDPRRRVLCEFFRKPSTDHEGPSRDSPSRGSDRQFRKNQRPTSSRVNEGPRVIEDSLPFRLSGVYGHKTHTDSCFLLHVADAVKLHNHIDNLETQIRKLKEVLVIYHRRIFHTATLLRTVGPRQDVAEFKDELAKWDELLKYEKSLQPDIIQEEFRLEGELLEARGKMSITMEAVYATGESYSNQVITGSVTQISNEVVDFAEKLQTTKLCAEQLKEEKANMAAARAGPLDTTMPRESRAMELKARKLRWRRLKVLSETLRYFEAALTNLAEPLLGSSAVPVYRCTTANLKLLTQAQEKVGNINEQGDSTDSELSRRSGLNPEGRPIYTRFPSNGDATGHPPRSLLVEFYDSKEEVRQEEEKLKNLRKKYYDQIVLPLLALPGLDRAGVDERRHMLGGNDFRKDEELAKHTLEASQERHRIAREAIKRYRDTEATKLTRAPIFTEKTSDHNSGGTAPLAVGDAAAEAYHAKVRKWTKPLAREVVPGTAGVELAPSDCSPVVGVRTLIESERSISPTISNESVVEGRQRWVGRAKTLHNLPVDVVSQEFPWAV